MSVLTVRKQHPCSQFPHLRMLKTLIIFLEWYQNFIASYAHLWEPLYKLKWYLSLFVCISEAQEAYEQMNIALTTAPVLVFNRLWSCLWTFYLRHLHGPSCNAGPKGKAISHAPRSLSSAERNNPITKRESLAVVCAHQNFRPYFSDRPVTVITDHVFQHWTAGWNL